MNNARKLACSMVLLWGVAVFMPEPAQSQPKCLPFTAEEDVDGARFVWWGFGEAGFRYRYIRTKLFPESGRFGQIPGRKPQPGDVAWWKEFAAIYTGAATEKAELLTGNGIGSLKSFEDKYGPVKWLRLLVPASPSEPPNEKLALLDTRLATLDPTIGTFPPAISSEDGLAKTKVEWEKAEKEFLALLELYPNSAEANLRLGDLYRMGHNIDIPGAWKKSEVHYEKALDLSPWSMPAYLGLGTLYVNTDFKYAAKAEPLFIEAIKVSYGQELPVAALSGLAFSLYYQGRLPEAIKAADRYIELRPHEPNIRIFRDIVQGVLNRSTARP